MPRAAPNIARISKTSVDAAKPRPGRYMLWDNRLKGFGLLVMPSGVKTYVARYRAGGLRAGPIRRFSVGRHGTITAEQARIDAGRILADATRDLDPQADRAKKRADITISQLCDLYVAEGCATKKPATLATDKSRIEGHIKPLLGSKRVGAITSADIERFQRDVAAGKSAAPVKPSRQALRAKGIKGAALDAIDTRKRKDSAPRGGKGAASRTMGLLGAIFSFAAGRRLRTDNPVRGVPRFKDGQSQRYLSAEELGRLGAALVAAEAAKLNPHGVAVIRLLFLTGARKSEIEGLRWVEVDPVWGCLRLPDSKTGAKVVPIGPPAFAVLNDLLRSNSSAFVFPAQSDPKRHYVGTPRVWEKVKALAVLPGVRLHDARHTLASLAVGGGQSLPIIGAILGHRDVKTTQQYAHLAASPVRTAIGVISQAAADAMAGPAPDPPGGEWQPDGGN